MIRKAWNSNCRSYCKAVMSKARHWGWWLTWSRSQRNWFWVSRRNLDITQARTCSLGQYLQVRMRSQQSYESYVVPDMWSKRCFRHHLEKWERFHETRYALSSFSWFMASTNINKTCISRTQTEPETFYMLESLVIIATTQASHDQKSDSSFFFSPTAQQPLQSQLIPVPTCAMSFMHATNGTLRELSRFELWGQRAYKGKDATRGFWPYY